MTPYDEICDFQNLYEAQKKTRLGKRYKREVMAFEMDLGSNLQQLSHSLKNNTYQVSGYYNFSVHEPKERVIHAAYYQDRIVQRCLCDQVLIPALQPRLIYDSAACQKGKGTHFGLYRVTKFMREYYKEYGTNGYILKYDIRKFFENIHHDVLKRKLEKAISDEKVLLLLNHIIDSYRSEEGKGIPLGNQTSQWFGLYYLDVLDRLIKEKLRIRFYSRYMDDGLLIHPSKQYLKECLVVMQEYVEQELHLEFNDKTQLIALKNGAEYLGFHFYLTKTGKVIRKMKTASKNRFKRRIKKLQLDYAAGDIDFTDVKQSLASYQGHLKHGHTYKLRAHVFNDMVFSRTPQLNLQEDTES